ncbi:MAG: PfkB family carbohydrate kinase [Pleomorphochaeta sp.]
MKKALVVCLNPTFQKTYMFDKFYIGEVNRESFHREDASGKGINVSRVLTQKNIDNAIITHLATQDEERMLDLTKRDNISLKYVLDDDSRVRTCSTILIKDKSTTEIVEESTSVNSLTDSKIRALFESEIVNYDYLLITGTRSPNYREDIYMSFVKRARELNKFVILDIAKDELIKCIKYRPNIIKPNLSEFMKTFFNEEVLENEDSSACLDKVKNKVKELYDEFNVISIISRGVNPIWVYDNTGFYQIPIEQTKKCVNTIGCGDTISASLIANLIENYDMKNSLKRAVIDARLNAESIIPGSLI